MPGTRQPTCSSEMDIAVAVAVVVEVDLSKAIEGSVVFFPSSNFCFDWI
jgi:hypothetical protein